MERDAEQRQRLASLREEYALEIARDPLRPVESLRELRRGYFERRRAVGRGASAPPPMELPAWRVEKPPPRPRAAVRSTTPLPRKRPQASNGSPWGAFQVLAVFIVIGFVSGLFNGRRKRVPTYVSPPRLERPEWLPPEIPMVDPVDSFGTDFQTRSPTLVTLLLEIKLLDPNTPLREVEESMRQFGMTEQKLHLMADSELESATTRMRARRVLELLGQRRAAALGLPGNR